MVLLSALAVLAVLMLLMVVMVVVLLLPVVFPIHREQEQGRRVGC